MKTNLKTCTECRRELPESAFYRYRYRYNGADEIRLMAACKDCKKRRSEDYRKHNREKLAIYFAKLTRTPERRSYNVVAQRRQRAKNPEKYKARSAVSNAIRDGRLHRGPCAVCGDTDTQAHHADYSKPLDVVWYCFRHHREDGHGQMTNAF